MNNKYDIVSEGIVGRDNVKKIKEFSKKQNKGNIIKKILGEKPKDSKWIQKDDDKDGVVNGLDCEPQNPKEQGFFHKAANFFKGKGFQDREYQRKQQIKRDKELKDERESFAKYKQNVQQQEEYERLEEAQAKKTLGTFGRKVYEGYDKLRDTGQMVVRGFKEMKDYSDASNIYDYAESEGYKQAQKDSQKEGVTGFVGKIAKSGIDLGEGTIRA